MKLLTEQEITKHKDALLLALDEKKAIDVVSLEIQEKSSIGDYLVITSGNSRPHTQALSHEIQSYAKEQELTYHVEGGGEGNWILVDLGFIIIHIMQAEAREFYNLEQLWSHHAEDDDA